MYEREKQFVENFFDHDNWSYEPITFRFDGIKYRPDFYDKKRNVYIEVAGTRQAYNANKAKYILFRKSFPDLTLEIRKPSGELLKKKKTIQELEPKEIKNMNKIAIWIKKQGLKNIEIAAIIGIDPTYLSHLLATRRAWPPHIALKVEKITKGQVRKEDLVWPKKEPRVVESRRVS